MCTTIFTTSKWQSNKMHKHDAILQKCNILSSNRWMDNVDVVGVVGFSISNIIYRIINLDSCFMFFSLSFCLIAEDFHQHFQWNHTIDSHSELVRISENREMEENSHLNNLNGPFTTIIQHLKLGAMRKGYSHITIQKIIITKRFD